MCHEKRWKKKKVDPDAYQTKLEIRTQSRWITQDVGINSNIYYVPEQDPRSSMPGIENGNIVLDGLH